MNREMGLLFSGVFLLLEIERKIEKERKSSRRGGKERAESK
jgi:hypothetical protein